MAPFPDSDLITQRVTNWQ